jgi:L-ascorbate metabolism protein UlaG (beta-lactamase superfamily)
VIRLADERTIYFAGDTCLFGDMQLIRHLYEPDYAALPIGDYFTMNPRDAAIAIDMLGNPACIPCHWGTFPLLTGTPEQLVAEAPNAIIHHLEPGDTIELD